MKKGTKGQPKTYLWQRGCPSLCVSKHTVSDKNDTLLHMHILRETHTQMRTSTYTILEDAEYSWQTESVLVSQLQPSVGFEDSPSSQLDKGLTSSPTYYFLPSRWSCNYLRMRSLTMRKRRPEIQGEKKVRTWTFSCNTQRTDSENLKSFQGRDS